MKKVIVTGASKFIGKSLTRRLLELGCLVYAVVRDSQKLAELSHERLRIIEAELTEYAQLDCLITERGFDAFFI